MISVWVIWSIKISVVASTISTNRCQMIETLACSSCFAFRWRSCSRSESIWLNWIFWIQLIWILSTNNSIERIGWPLVASIREAQEFLRSCFLRHSIKLVWVVSSRHFIRVSWSSVFVRITLSIWASATLSAMFADVDNVRRKIV